LIDLFDPCSKAIQKVKKALAKNWQVLRIEQASMETYEWKDEHSAILLRWCLGYPEDEDLVAFLRSAKEHLMQYGQRATRQTIPRSFILVLDNLLEDGQLPFEDEGQTIRDQQTIERLFEQAGLRTHMQSEPIKLHSDFKPVMLWALY